MNFLNIKELEKHAMKSRYGWKRFFVFRVDNDIQLLAEDTARRVKVKMGEFDEHQARLDFVRQFPVKD